MTDERARILHVTKNHDDTLGLILMLQPRQDFEICSEPTLTNARAALRSKKPVSLVIVDYPSFEEKTFDFIKEVQDRWVPVVLITGHKHINRIADQGEALNVNGIIRGQILATVKIREIVLDALASA